MSPRLGLRGKSALALIGLCMVALVPAGLLGWQAVESVHRHFATAYVEQYTLQHQHQIVAPVVRELALAGAKARSSTTRQWLQSEEDPEARLRYFADAEEFRQQFAEGTYFTVVRDSGNYYFGDGDTLDASTPRYQLEPDNPDDAWFYRTIAEGDDFNLNVDFDRGLGVTNVWINVLVRDHSGTPIGVTGTGIELTRFLERFIRDDAPGLTPMIVDERGAIQAHPDPDRIAMRSGALGDTERVETAHTLEGLLAEGEDFPRLLNEMGRVRYGGDTIRTAWVTMNGRPQLMAVGYVPELNWHVITALDPSLAQIFDETWLWSLFASLAIVLAALLAAFMVATDRLVIRPINLLRASARRIAGGQYQTELPTARRDEIGELSRTFADMAEQVRHHTGKLEELVRARTHELEEANARMVEAHHKIQDSIEYASIIQRAILPDDQLDAHFEHQYGVLWKPRDTVGGDFYVFRPGRDAYLLGVVDCAGHGVPGSLMTMLARAIIDHAIQTTGEGDPAAILNEVDRKLREMLPESGMPSSISTNMDIGLVAIRPSSRQMRFAGAKMALYASDGAEVKEWSGTRKAIGHRRPVQFQNVEVALQSDWTYCLCTDGFLDQAGGANGFGFGDTRFRELFRTQANRPLDEQIAAFESSIQAYQGELPQRDDITVLTFRFREPPQTA